MHVEDTPALLEELRHGEHSGVVTATGEGAEGAEAGVEKGAAGGEGEEGHHDYAALDMQIGTMDDAVCGRRSGEAEDRQESRN